MRKFTQNENPHWLTTYVVANLLIGSLISISFYQVHANVDTVLGKLFAVLHTVGHLGLLSFIAASPLYIINRLNKGANWTLNLAVLFGTLGITALVADTFVYQQYRFHINSMVLEMFIYGGSEVIAFPLLMWVKVIAIIIFISATQWILAKLTKASPVLTLSNVDCLKWLAPFCLILANLIHIWADATYYKDVTSQGSYLPLAQPATAKSLMAKYGFLNMEAYKQQALLKQGKHRGDLRYPLVPIRSQPISQPYNVIFIVIDSWRADMMNEEVTPNIAKLAKQSSQFNNHYSGSNNTRHGMFSLFYGIPGSYWEPILQQQTSPVLIDTFTKKGYQSNVFASAKLTMPEFDQTLFASIDNLRTHSQGKLPWQRDVNIVNEFKKKYSNQSATLNVLFFDAAHGFSVPDNYNLPFTPSLKSANYLDLDDNYDAVPFKNLYKNSLHFVDHQVGRVLELITADLDNTVVVITGDHGKEFNDNKKGYWGHNSNYSQHQTKVPLIIHWPNKPIETVKRLTSHFDIVPTLMRDLLMVPNPTSDYSSGQSLFSESHLRSSVLMGRKGYYAIKDTNYVYELDRVGNFEILDSHYQEQPEATLNMTEIKQAMNEMSRFYQTSE